MKIRQKVVVGFLGIISLIVMVGYFVMILSQQIYGLRRVELPMEQNLREVEVSIWEAIHAADSFRLTGNNVYEQLYNKQIGDVNEFYQKYQALTDTGVEKEYIEQFNILWEEAQTAGNKLIRLTKEQEMAESKFFINIDEADDVLDFEIQSKWSSDDPSILAKEQAVREVEVSIWEAIHASEQYVGLSHEIVRGSQKHIGEARTVAKAAAKASLVKGSFKDLMERQFEDVHESWTNYRALPHDDFENTAIQQFELLWEKAVLEGRKIISLHDQAHEQFNILFDKVNKADDIIDFKMQEFIRKRIDRHAEAAKVLRTATIAVVFLAFLCSIGVGLFITHSISAPITKLKDAAAEIGWGKFDTKIEIKSHDEIGQLAASFKKMTEDLKKTTTSIDSLNKEIVERKQAEKGLRRSEERFRNLSTELDLGLSEVFKALDEISSGNPEVRIPETSEIELVTKLKQTVNLTAQNLKEIVDLSHEFAIGLAEHFDILHRVSQGNLTARVSGTSQVELLESLKKVTNQMIESVSKEITNREWAEKQLREYSEQLEEKVEERTKELKDAQEQMVRREKLAVLGELAGGVAHEIRNPLGAIKNAGYLLNMAIEEPEPEVKETIEILQKEVETSERVVNNLLDFARPKPPTRCKVNINDVVQATLSHVSVPDNVEVVQALDEKLPIILADPDQLTKAFGNLVLNAVQAMPKGGRLVAHAEVLNAERVTVTFADTGAGINDEALGNIFEPLFTTKAKGIGLGLALTKVLVEAHEGTIDVESKVGKGTAFTVSLPIGEEKQT